MELKELEAMLEGLRIALKYAKDRRRFAVLEGMYAESLVAMKLLMNKRIVEFHSPPFDLLVDGKKKIEVKCGKLWDYGAGASFGKGNQIRENKFDYCVFVIIDKDSFKPKKFFVFSIKELKECTTLRPKMTKPETPSILFYYKDFDEFEVESERTGEPVFNIEKKLHTHPEWFEDRWDKISS